MKTFKKTLLLLGGIAATGMLGSAASPKEIFKAAAPATPTYQTKLPTVIDLKDSTEGEIRSYYSSLNSLDNAELTGDNLLKNLKPILQDFQYFNYDAVWKIYEITDREWALSPAASDATNDITFDEASQTFTKYTYGTSNTKGGSNPYVRTLYRNRDDKGVTVEAGRIREWGDHNASGTNREHVWCQSRGFKADSGASGPAGTDVHHLISGDGKVNQAYHNNTPYGNVDKTKTYKNASKDSSFLDGNLLGTAKNLHPGLDVGTEVFEPQDSDKGDIARALFYMAACYNNISGNETITEFNPNLVLVNYITDAGEAEASSATHPVAMGILDDLLEWHKNDPVDEYEIHRNNLIYKNFQHNRNPFIDFPEWVDIVWGSKKGTASAKPQTDVVYAGKGTAPAGPSTPSKPSEGEGLSIADLLKNINPMVFVGIGVAAVIILIIIIVIFASLSKKDKKKVIKAFNEVSPVDIPTKKKTTTTRKKSTSSSTKKKSTTSTKSVNKTTSTTKKKTTK